MWNAGLLFPFTLQCCHDSMLYPTCEIVSNHRISWYLFPCSPHGFQDQTVLKASRLKDDIFSCKMNYLCLFVCFWQLYLYFFTGCSAGVQSFSLIVLILLEVTQYILQWLKLDDKIKMKEELCCPVVANYELSKDTEEKKSLFKKLRNQSQNTLHVSEVFWFIVISLDTSSKSFLFVSRPFIVF